MNREKDIFVLNIVPSQKQIIIKLIEFSPPNKNYWCIHILNLASIYFHGLLVGHVDGKLVEILKC